MATIRNSIESFVYPILEYYTDAVYKGGEDTVIRGIRVLDDSSKFTHGTLVNGAATLYAYYVKVGDKRADEVLKRFHAFLYLAAKSECKTWGKLAILRAFNTLRENGLLDKIDPKAVELVKTRTEYTDFFDKETCTLRGYATNYYQVAMACAGYRELLGWEMGEPFAEKIKEKLTEHRFVHSLNVADSAKELARLYGYDEDVAYTTGLIHDTCKDTPAGLQLSYMLENGMELLVDI